MKIKRSIFLLHPVHGRSPCLREMPRRSVIGSHRAAKLQRDPTAPARTSSAFPSPPIVMAMVVPAQPGPASTSALAPSLSPHRLAWLPPLIPFSKPVRIGEEKREIKIKEKNECWIAPKTLVLYSIFVKKKKDTTLSDQQTFQILVQISIISKSEPHIFY